MIPAVLASAGAIQAMGQVYDRLKEGKDKVDGATAHFKSNSLTQLAQAMRVEPLTLVDSDLSNSEYLSDLLHCMHSLFTGYYLQAIDALGMVSGVKVMEKLAPLNPNRALAREHLGPELVNESYRFALPAPHKKHLQFVQPKALATEALGDAKDYNAILRENASLSIGKYVDVTVSGDDPKQQARVRMAIRLIVNEIPTSGLVSMLTFSNTFDNDLAERWVGVKSGRLSFWQDFVMCRDLIKANRNAQIKDKSGVLSTIQKRATGNTVAGLKSGKPSLATASNLLVISDTTLAQIEAKMGARFSNYKVRQEIFERTQLMIIAVLHKESEMVTFYTYGVQETSHMTVRELKQASKGSGNVEVLDIMKAFMAGGAANI